ncbi:MAG: RHS repeat-associated core domain-containing protein, partial [Verrucomicrobiae bacterium]|nr:RHS repeat-associated core domain-containing protein [Verrucomicrobiae bacterium]
MTTDWYLHENVLGSATPPRFLQPDPIGFDAEDVNLYRYLGNDCINLNDPNGLKSQKTCKGCKEDYNKCMDVAEKVYNKAIEGINKASQAAWDKHIQSVQDAVQKVCGDL